VSNHGGRQLDGAPSSISVLPQIAEAVNGRIEVFFDGGIRTGADIVKAMGCGADACLTGRGYLYGLAARGYDGVKRALELLRDELHDCMVLCGLNDIAGIPPGVVTRAAIHRGNDSAGNTGAAMSELPRRIPEPSRRDG